MIFFLFHIEIEGKGGWIIGRAKGYVGPPLKLFGGGGGGGGLPPPPLAPPPPLPTPMNILPLITAEQTVQTPIRPFFRLNWA